MKGLVVAPGFIDLHVHSHSAESYQFQARDGVTTSLELEIGVWPVAPWYAAGEGKSLLNFGAGAARSGGVPPGNRRRCVNRRVVGWIPT